MFFFELLDLKRQPEMPSILYLDDRLDPSVPLHQDWSPLNRKIVPVARLENALQLIEAEPFDLVVTEWLVNGRPAVEVFRKAKPALPILVVSRYTAGSYVAQALRLRVIDYLFKPCTDGEIVQRVQAWFDELAGHHRELSNHVLAMCHTCRKICDTLATSEPWAGNWIPLERFLNIITGLEVSHGSCPQCSLELEKELKNLIADKSGQ